MTAVLALIQTLFAIVLDALSQFVKTVVLSAALLISLFIGSVLIIIQVMMK